jgi:hypothetical protein
MKLFAECNLDLTFSQTSLVRSTVFWDVTPCSLIECHLCPEETQLVHLQGGTILVSSQRGTSLGFEVFMAVAINNTTF